MRIYENPMKTSENRLPPRSYYIPRGRSTYTLLNGDLVFAGSFEAAVSRYTTAAIDRADHIDELVADGHTHLRTDYRTSGLGSHSCGPALPARDQLNDKTIAFSLTIRPR